MVSERLTPQEQAKHAKGIEKIRRKLFRRHPPQEYFIVPGSERVLAASAESRWCSTRGEYRVFRFGGLTYTVDCCDPAGLSEFSVLHFDADTFTFWLAAATRYTVSSINVRFVELDEVAYKYVTGYRRANVAPVYVGHRKV